jgi:hypothetical protein
MPQIVTAMAAATINHRWAMEFLRVWFRSELNIGGNF